MKLSIIGTGSFGLALASRFKNVNITMWTKFEEEKNMLSQWNLLTPAQRAAVINIIGLLLSSD